MNRPLTVLFSLVFCFFFLLASFLPVLAQEGGELLPSTDTPTVTETIEVSTPTLTQTEISVDTSTATANSTETSTATIENTITPTVTITSSPTATKTALATKTQVTCNLDDVYQYQIVVGYETSPMPYPSVQYSLVNSSTNEEGGKTSVLQVSKANYCGALAELQSRTDVVFAEPNYEISLLETVPNDEYVNSQYYLTNIRAPQGWDYETGSPAIIVAVLDTGVDLAHSDLASKLVPGYDYIEEDNIPQDANGHGTHVAGIIAAVTNNSSGIAGISWGGRIMPLRVLDAYGNGSYADTAEAIRYAADHGAQVINMSIGGTKYSEVLESAVNYAVSLGVVMVAATGNSGASVILYPASFGGVIAVGATDSANQHASFSNTGSGIDVVAPGVSILSLYPGNSYTTLSGTSMATPMVAGFAALLWSLPEVTSSSQIVNIIKSTAKDLGSAGWDSYFGFGLIQIGPGIIYAIGNPPTLTPSPTSKHIYSTTTVTPTNTQSYFYSTRNPTYDPLAGSASPTVTPGEISMQEVSPTLLSSITQTPEPNGPSTPNATNPVGVESEKSVGTCLASLLLAVGILYILFGAGLFIFVWKRYLL